MNTSTFPSEDMAKSATLVWSLAKSIKIAMISSRDIKPAVSNGAAKMLGTSPERSASGTAAPAAWPMRARFREDNCMIWFIVERTNKITEWLAAPLPQPVLVTFSNGGQGDHIVFEGDAILSDDRMTLEALWDHHAEIHFPQGMTDSSATLLQFSPRSAHYWTGGQDMISFAVHYAKARLTGEAQTVGTHGNVMPVEHEMNQQI